MNTKAYVILLAAIVVIGFSFIGVIILHDPAIIKKHSKQVILNLDSMKETGDNIIDSVYGPAILKIFPANKQNTKGDSIPWADAYLCYSSGKTNSSPGDTLILLLDTKTDNNLYKIKYPNEYWTGVKKSPKFKKCRIIVPVGQLARIKGAKYKFASVKLITDDGGLE